MPFHESHSHGDLLAETQVRPDPSRPGVYHATTTRFFVALTVHGGVLLTLALRAAQQALDRAELSPLSAHATYCEGVPAGPVEIEVQVLRQGRSVAQVCAQLRAADSDTVALHVVATFARPRPDTRFAFDQRRFPQDVRPVEALSELQIPQAVLDVTKDVALQFQYQWRVAVGETAWEPGWAPREGRACAWTRTHKPPMRPDGLFDPLCYAFLADVLLPAFSQALGPFVALQLATPTLNLDLQFFATTRSEWLLQHVRCQESRDGFVMSTVELWDTDKRLVATASQRALVRKIV